MQGAFIMECNVGKGDKTIRIVVGLAIIILGFVYQSWWGLIGALPLISAATGWCPAYLPFGISTCKVKKEQTGKE
jgi:Inner membrane protein YgaP-like, transmembrane domain